MADPFKTQTDELEDIRKIVVPGGREAAQRDREAERERDGLDRELRNARRKAAAAGRRVDLSSSQTIAITERTLAERAEDVIPDFSKMIPSPIDPLSPAKELGRVGLGLAAEAGSESAQAFVNAPPGQGFKAGFAELFGDEERTAELDEAFDARRTELAAGRKENNVFSNIGLTSVNSAHDIDANVSALVDAPANLLKEVGGTLINATEAVATGVVQTGLDAIGDVHGIDPEIAGRFRRNDYTPAIAPVGKRGRYPKIATDLAEATLGNIGNQFVTNSSSLLDQSVRARQLFMEVAKAEGKSPEEIDASFYGVLTAPLGGRIENHPYLRGFEIPGADKFGAGGKHFDVKDGITSDYQLARFVMEAALGGPPTNEASLFGRNMLATGFSFLNNMRDPGRLTSAPSDIGNVLLGNEDKLEQYEKFRNTQADMGAAAIGILGSLALPITPKVISQSKLGKVVGDEVIGRIASTLSREASMLSEHFFGTVSSGLVKAGMKMIEEGDTKGLDQLEHLYTGMVRREDAFQVVRDYAEGMNRVDDRGFTDAVEKVAQEMKRTPEYVKNAIKGQTFFDRVFARNANATLKRTNPEKHARMTAAQDVANELMHMRERELITSAIDGGILVKMDNTSPVINAEVRDMPLIPGNAGKAFLREMQAFAPEIETIDQARKLVDRNEPVVSGFVDKVKPNTAIERDAEETWGALRDYFNIPDHIVMFGEDIGKAFTNMSLGRTLQPKEGQALMDLANDLASSPLGLGEKYRRLGVPTFASNDAVIPKKFTRAKKKNIYGKAAYMFEFPARQKGGVRPQKILTPKDALNYLTGKTGSRTHKVIKRKFGAGKPAGVARRLPKEHIDQLGDYDLFFKPKQSEVNQLMKEHNVSPVPKWFKQHFKDDKLVDDMLFMRNEFQAPMRRWKEVFDNVNDQPVLKVIKAVTDKWKRLVTNLNLGPFQIRNLIDDSMRGYIMHGIEAISNRKSNVRAWDALRDVDRTNELAVLARKFGIMNPATVNRTGLAMASSNLGNNLADGAVRMGQSFDAIQAIPRLQIFDYLMRVEGMKPVEAAMHVHTTFGTYSQANKFSRGLESFVPFARFLSYDMPFSFAAFARSPERSLKIARLFGIDGKNNDSLPMWGKGRGSITFPTAFTNEREGSEHLESMVTTFMVTNPMEGVARNMKLLAGGPMTKTAEVLKNIGGPVPAFLGAALEISREGAFEDLSKGEVGRISELLMTALTSTPQVRQLDSMFTGIAALGPEVILTMPKGVQSAVRAFMISQGIVGEIPTEDKRIGRLNKIFNVLTPGVNMMQLNQAVHASQPQRNLISTIQRNTKTLEKQRKEQRQQDRARRR